jgi:hypothetical protein
MILDPVTRTITHLVIATRHHSADGRLVPLDLADATDGEIRVRCTLAEFECLDPAEEVELVDYPGYGGSYEAAEAAQGYGDVGAVGVGGAGIGMSLRDEPRAVVSDTIPPGETDLAWHERVHAVDGEIGRIEGFVVNRADRKVTHVLLKEGHLWGRKEVAIPVSAVASVEHGIRLNITKQQVEDLPPRDQ